MKGYVGVTHISPVQQIALQAIADHSAQSIGDMIGKLIECLAQQALDDAGYKEGMSGPTAYDYVRCLLAKDDVEATANDR